MPAKGSKTKVIEGPKFVVTREFFDQFFEKPMPTGSFHDLVHKGKVIPWQLMRGCYYANESLCRLGL